MAPVMVCVVLTGIPASAVENSVIAPAASAQNPPTGFSFVMREPMVDGHGNFGSVDGDSPAA